MRVSIVVALVALCIVVGRVRGQRRRFRRIVNGTEAVPHSHPYQVKVWLRNVLIRVDQCKVYMLDNTLHMYVDSFEVID